MEPTLGSVLFSMQVNPGWMSSCRDVANYMSSVSSDVFRERQESEDRMSAKWSDAMLGFERLYNPDTGEVYQTGQWFPRTYEMNREKFEMQNLRELTPEEWAIIPVDGALHIK
jgi:hypothetical protein